MRCSNTQNDRDRKYQLDIFIPTRDRPDSLPLTLLQLSNQTAPLFRVIIGDGGNIPAKKNGSVRYAINILKEKGHTQRKRS